MLGKKITHVMYLILDESMSQWRKRISKKGGHPHISHEPCKPVPWGTMIKHAIECTTGIFVHHGIVESSTVQWKKKYSSPAVKSHHPKSEDISYHTAGVLH